MAFLPVIFQEAKLDAKSLLTQMLMTGVPLNVATRLISEHPNGLVNVGDVVKKDSDERRALKSGWACAVSHVIVWPIDGNENSMENDDAL